jgi:hypothetical protein
MLCKLPQFCAHPKWGFLIIETKVKRGAKSSVENPPNGSEVWVHKKIGHVMGSAGKIVIMCGKIAVVWQWARDPSIGVGAWQRKGA